MAKSAFVVPAFPVAAFTDAVVSNGETVAEALERIEAAKDAVRAVFSQYTDRLLVDATVPKDNSGRNAIRKCISNGIKQAVTEDAEKGGCLGDILASELIFKKSTLSQYTTGVILCYMNGAAWRASAANTPEQGGEERPEWWNPENAGKGAATAKQGEQAPSEVEVVNPDTLRIELTQVVARARLLGFDSLADQIFDAILASPLKPVPPAK